MTEYQFEEIPDGKDVEGEMQYKLTNHYPVIEYKGWHLRPYNKHGSSPTYSLTLCEQIQHNFLRYFSLPLRLKTPPPRIGKATIHKMDTWLEYLLEVEKLKKEYIENKQEKIKNFRNTLRTFAGGLKWDLTKDSGEIERGGIIYTYKIDNCGSIEQKLKFPFRIDNNIQTFMDISENLYKKKKPEVFLLYSCDTQSQNLTGIFSSKEKLERYINELKVAGMLNDNNLHQLQTIRQTQGLKVNYMIEILPLNPLLAVNGED